MAKENIKSNIVEAPTLFVGVGGTGCRIVKGVAEMCRPGETENINFLCLDTNVNDLQDVAKSGARIFRVQTSNTQTVGSYLDYDEDALRNWFPKNAVLYDKTVSEGAGQVRAISRLALNAAIKTGKVGQVYEAIDDLFRKSGREMKQAMRCIMVSTASGGTGSGIVMPLAMFIRDYVNNKYPSTSLTMRSLILLPETLDSVITSTVERDSQRRNAYATIKEINAFMMMGSGFFDINEDLKRYKGLHVDIAAAGQNENKSLSLLPFDFCFLMDGQNSEDNTLVSTSQYEEQAAQALYEQNIGPMQKQAYSQDDNIVKELSNPGNYGRNRFGGIGAGVIRYPYDSVVKYIAYDWAINSIGGEAEAAKWSRYDNAYAVKAQEAEKKGLAASDAPQLEDVYVDTLKTAQDNFSKDLKSTFFLNDANKRINTFFTALEEHMKNALTENSAIRTTRDAANDLSVEIDYDQPGNCGHAVSNKQKLRAYHMCVRSTAQKIAQSAAEAVFFNEKKTINETAEYTVEKLMHAGTDKICHPNAARYILYMLKKELEKRYKDKKDEIDSGLLPNLEVFAQNARNNDNKFEVEFNGENHEYSLDALCELEKSESEKPGFIEKLKGYKKIYEKFNQLFPEYFRAITDYAEAVVVCEAYRTGAEYVGELCKMYERFFHTFKTKVAALERKQDDLVDSLAFKKGDSVYNVCAKKEQLMELSVTTAGLRDKGNMLDKELNGAIFDAVKQNVQFERETRFADVVEEDRSVDIFDQVLVESFVDQVRRSCTSIDMNVIEAIAMEYRVNARIKMREEQQNQGNGESVKIIDNISIDDTKRYISEIIAMGRRLSAPGIQSITNEEAREINACAYNKSLQEMRQYRIKELLPKGTSCDTVSRYELHFFNALYNLTPDKLKKFACPKKMETGVKNAGLYHNAYVSYSKHIGPDSTKNMMISTHIDKRWDSVAVLPELDLDYQNRRIMKIHKAMIYALVYGAISYRNLSVAAKGKMIYKYENSDERTEDLIVSNGTLCDEFFEILDALYINSAVVEDIDVIKKKKRARDVVRNSNYTDTTFAKELAAFHIETLHDGPTSLFEIPLAYYNSLPTSQRFVSEITALVDAVIEVLSEELSIWERQEDRKFLLCDLLQEQFDLFMRNYKEYKELNMGVDAGDNLVVSLAYRKIRNVLITTPEPDDYESTLDSMKQLIG